MPEIRRRTEEEIARSYNEELAREFKRKKLSSVVLMGASIAFGVACLAVELPMLAFCCLMTVFIGMIRYWDASGQVDEVQRRPVKFLHAPLSVLKPDEKAETSSSAIPHSG